MNFSFYIIGTPEGRYSQYPDDYTAPTLSNLQEGVDGARLVIYRDMDLVHYVYTERIGTNAILGFCLIFNKVRISKPTQLIQLFRFYGCISMEHGDNRVQDKGYLCYDYQNQQKHTCLSALVAIA